LSFGEAVKKERERQGMSRAELAQSLGIARQTIFRIESKPGYKPHNLTVKAIAKALKLSMDQAGPGRRSDPAIDPEWGGEGREG